MKKSAEVVRSRRRRWWAPVLVVLLCVGMLASGVLLIGRYAADRAAVAEHNQVAAQSLQSSRELFEKAKPFTAKDPQIKDTAATPKTTSVLASPKASAAASSSASASEVASPGLDGVPLAQDAPVQMDPHMLSVPSVGLVLNLEETGMVGRKVTVPAAPMGGLVHGDARLNSGSGVSAVVAHVDYLVRGHRAPMSLITLMKPGAKIFLTDGAGKLHTYVAVSGRYYPQQSLPADLLTGSGAPKLILVTCGGRIGPDGWFEDNWVVTAVPAD